MGAVQRAEGRTGGALGMLRFALLLVLDVPLSVSLLLFYDQSETSIFIFLTGDLIC